ncbi:Rtc1p ASCRUDRAFT_72144 [Ascoidea rubescens DSM 1968]|uniref:Restriction of telomere capping protein 1 n=1 Tax=Ascoidea rubescens DSM 1968 TaxID=1344418 RepID=A0A1D2VBY7_9ASCO|nr:hypothetical protein ASCRUDRAFT_72144 [Ascoidea rubescens DSM 1968]ODV59072.1 hypothetical protein ASCRUDRAFT_72144 [Ascoidea rubescens DSM 1968]
MALNAENFNRTRRNNSSNHRILPFSILNSPLAQPGSNSSPSSSSPINNALPQSPMNNHNLFLQPLHGSDILDRTSSNYKKFSYKTKTSLNFASYTEIQALSSSNDPAHPNRVVIAGKSLIQVLDIDNENSTITIVKDVLKGSFLQKNVTQLGSIFDIRFGYHSNKNLIAVASITGSVYVFDNSDASSSTYNKIVNNLKAHNRPVNSIAFSPHDSNLLMSGSRDGVIKIWDLRSEEPVKSLSANADVVRCNEYSPHDPYSIVATYDSGSIVKWDLRNNKQEKRFNGHNKGGLTLEWNNKFNYIVSGGSDQQIQVWNMSSKNIQDRSQPDFTINTSSQIAKVSWSPFTENCSSVIDCQVASCYLGNNSFVNVWDLKRNFIPRFVLAEHSQPATGLCWKDQNHIWTCSKDKLFIQHDLRSERCTIEDLPKTSVKFNWSRFNEVCFISQNDDCFTLNKNRNENLSYDKGHSVYQSSRHFKENFNDYFISSKETNQKYNHLLNSTPDLRNSEDLIDDSYNNINHILSDCSNHISEIHAQNHGNRVFFPKFSSFLFKLKPRNLFDQENLTNENIQSQGTHRDSHGSSNLDSNNSNSSSVVGSLPVPQLQRHISFSNHQINQHGVSFGSSNQFSKSDQSKKSFLSGNSPHSPILNKKNENLLTNHLQGNPMATYNDIYDFNKNSNSSDSLFASAALKIERSHSQSPKNSAFNDIPRPIIQRSQTTHQFISGLKENKPLQNTHYRNTSNHQFGQEVENLVNDNKNHSNIKNSARNPINVNEQPQNISKTTINIENSGKEISFQNLTNSPFKNITNNLLKSSLDVSFPLSSLVHTSSNSSGQLRSSVQPNLNVPSLSRTSSNLKPSKNYSSSNSFLDSIARNPEFSFKNTPIPLIYLCNPIKIERDFDLIFQRCSYSYFRYLGEGVEWYYYRLMEFLDGEELQIPRIFENGENLFSVLEMLDNKDKKPPIRESKSILNKLKIEEIRKIVDEVFFGYESMSLSDKLNFSDDFENAQIVCLIKFLILIKDIDTVKILIIIIDNIRVATEIQYFRHFKLWKMILTVILIKQENRKKDFMSGNLSQDQINMKFQRKGSDNNSDIFSNFDTDELSKEQSKSDNTENFTGSNRFYASSVESSTLSMLQLVPKIQVDGSSNKNEQNGKSDSNSSINKRIKKKSLSDTDDNKEILHAINQLRQKSGTSYKDNESAILDDSDESDEELVNPKSFPSIYNSNSNKVKSNFLIKNPKSLESSTSSLGMLDSSSEVKSTVNVSDHNNKQNVNHEDVEFNISHSFRSSISPLSFSVGRSIPKDSPLGGLIRSKSSRLSNFNYPLDKFKRDNATERLPGTLSLKSNLTKQIKYNSSSGEHGNVYASTVSSFRDERHNQNAKSILEVSQERLDKENLVKRINMNHSNGFPWNPERIITRVSSYATEEGDILMCVSLLLLFRNLFTKYQALEWVHGFIEILTRKRLFSISSLILKYCGLPEILNEGLKNTHINSFCFNCKNIITNDKVKLSENNEKEVRSRYWICENCKTFTSKCCYCDIPIKGLSLNLLTCGHHIHAECFKEWFDDGDERECPCGCGEVIFE